VVGVEGDADDGVLTVLTEAEEARRLLDREVAVDAGEDPLLVAGSRRVPAGEQQCLEVGLRATGREDPVGGVVVADPLCRPVDQVPLDEGAANALVEGVEAGVDAADEHLRHQRGDDDRAVEVGGVGRLVEPDRVVEPEPRELVEDGAGVTEGCVQVGRGDAARGLAGGGAAAGVAVGRGEVTNEAIGRAGDRRAVVAGVVRMEEMAQGGRHRESLSDGIR
jgi:hypothetical protein